MNKKPKYFDTFLLTCFVIFITFQPCLFHHEIIMMETGIHLPAISALINGAVPYRDFFYLRGPFELYIPAFLIKTFGGSMSLLPIFYYVGSVATLIFGVLLAHQIFRTRFIFYLMVPVLVARTFPEEWYFRNKGNIKKFNEMTDLILDNYSVIKKFESVSLYRRNQ